MWWKYGLVFLCSCLFDIVPIPLPPAFTVMIVLQITFDLNIWPVIILGVCGSILGRYLLTLYIPHISGKLFKPAKNEDVQFLGKKMKASRWKSQFFVFAYSLLPLPTTPLFIAGGMAKVKPIQIIPAFFLGKFISDTATVMMGNYAAQNADDLVDGMLSWKSIVGLALGLLLIAALLFIDWRTLLQKKKLTLKFKIWK
jgi:membrane protein YqaA with SNARE-associated domain